MPRRHHHHNLEPKGSAWIARSAGEDREVALRLIQQCEKTTQRDLVALNAGLVGQQQFPSACLAGHHFQKEGLGQGQGSVGVALRGCLAKAQHRVLDPQHIALFQIGENQVDGKPCVAGFFGVEPRRHRLQKARDRRLFHHVQRIGRRQSRLRWAAPQFMRAAEVKVAPTRRLGRIAQLLESSGQQFLGGCVFGVCEDGVLEQFGGPAELPCIKSELRRGLQLVGTPGERGIAPCSVYRRQRVEVGRMRVEPAQIELVDRLDVVPNRSIVAAHIEMLLQGLGQSQGLGDLRGSEAEVHLPDRLVVNESVNIALLADEVAYALAPPYGPVVLVEHHLGVGRVDDGVVEIVGPLAGVAHLRAAQGVDVVQGVAHQLGAAIRTQLG